MPKYPTATDLRRALERRVRAFVDLTGMSRTEISRKALNDGSGVARLLKDNNFKIASYDRVMAWLDMNWPRKRRRSDAKAVHPPP